MQRHIRPFFILLALLLLEFQSCQITQPDYKVQVLDPGLELTLMAQDPQITTPIGMAIDRNDAIYILESHTHSPPEGYTGPNGDLIKKVTDNDGDGLPETWSVFAEGINNGANLAIDNEGIVYVTAKKHLLSFEDLDGDGRSDRVDTLVILEPPEYVYDHAGLLGIALGPDGGIYCSRGNLGGKAWRLIAADGSFLQGYGTGGMIFRCEKDGSNLKSVASGFWNPFDLKFTHTGRLLATDNDPDSRGPNRLLEIVQGGRYGFECLYGGSGLHPYLAWNGEVPGTLPMVAPLGEAPCALIDASFTNFGTGYDQCILVNVWEEKNIVKIPLQKKESSIQGIPEVLIQGDTSFHPVALVTDSKGNLYISDWVKREYPNHGKGKIWRLSAKSPRSSPAVGTDASQIQRGLKKEDPQLLFAALEQADRFERTVLRALLNNENDFPAIISHLDDRDAQHRLEALLILLESDYFLDRDILLDLLHDEHPEVRKMALIYTGKKMRTDLEGSLKTLLDEERIGPDLMDIYLATVQHLQPEFIENYRNQTGVTADKQGNKFPENFLVSILRDHGIPGKVRSLVVPYLDPEEINTSLMGELLSTNESPELIGSLLHAGERKNDTSTKEMVLEISRNDQFPGRVRAQAVQVLSRMQDQFCSDLVQILSEDDDALVNYAALKGLNKCRREAKVDETVTAILQERSAADLLQVWSGENRMNANDQKSISEESFEKGNSDRGQIVFRQPSSQCVTCHKVHGWGGTIGPDLSRIGSSKSRQQLIDAVLNPSSEIAPEWQGWYVIDSMGKEHAGRQIDVHLNRAELMNLDGSFENFPYPRGYGVLENSIMPEGLEKALTRAEFVDLITYLQDLK